MNFIKQLHAHLISTGLSKHPSQTANFLAAYALSAAPFTDAARLAVDQPATTSAYNSLIRASSRSATPGDALVLYSQMRHRCLPPNSPTFTFVLKTCAAVPAIREGMGIHSISLRLGMVSDVYICNALIYLYSVCGELDCARKVFDEMSVRDLVSWNSLICGYGMHKRHRDVLALFEAMRTAGVKGDKVTMVKVISACSHLGEWELAEDMVRHIDENGIEVDVYLGNTLIDFYGRRRSVESADKVFSRMKTRNTLTFNAMITAYAKAGNLVAAREVFDGMPERDLISWTAIITGYSQASQFSDALSLFQEMNKAKVKADEIVIASVLSACARLGALEMGNWIHCYIQENSIKEDVYVGNSLIDMYSKCGCVTQALKIFREMKEKDTLSWNSVILGLANNGYAESALEVFSDMLRKGFQPTDVTFLGVLIACAHNGLVDKGLEIFRSMKEVHHVEPGMKHYGCVVDILGRAGELDKAHNFIKDMPVRPHPNVWRIMLGACKLHGNVGLAEIATSELIELEPSNSGNYVLLSNAYAAADRWEEATEVREIMTENDVHKAPGCSAIEDSCLRIAI